MILLYYKQSELYNLGDVGRAWNFANSQDLPTMPKKIIFDTPNTKNW